MIFKGNDWNIKTETSQMATTSGLNEISGGAASRIMPIVIDLGKTKRKRIKALKRGQGPLMQEVASVVNETRARIGDTVDKELVPIVLIYRRSGRRRDGGGLLPFRF